ncbi:MAG: U32 family peptidase, partial [Cyanobacteria bacterium J06573_2]
LPVSELNKMRREIVVKLEELRSQPKRWVINENASLKNLLPSINSNNSTSIIPDSANLIVLVRNLNQLEAALKTGITTIYCEFEDPRKYKEAVNKVKGQRSKVKGKFIYPQILVAPPRITKPLENWILQQVINSHADGYLIRNYDHLKFFANERCIGDFSLNIANPLTADYFKNKFNLERLTASYDLNIHQLQDLLKTSPPDWYEV